MRTKHIEFVIKLRGSGVFNRNTNEIARLEKARGLTLYDRIYDNVLVAKKRLEKGDNGSGVKAVLFISSNCMRDLIFSQDIGGECLQTAINYCPAADRNVLYGTFEGLVRGYLFADKSEDGTVKRKSPLTITEARQISGSEVTVEVQTTKGPRDDKSLVFAESVGEIEYESIGFIDLSELGFVSGSEIFDRRAFDLDYTDVFRGAVANTVGNKISAVNEAKYYVKTTSSSLLAEIGIKMNDEQVSALAVEAINRITRIFGRRRNAYVESKATTLSLILEDGTRRTIGSFEDPTKACSILREAMVKHPPWSAYAEASDEATSRSKALWDEFSANKKTKSSEKAAKSKKSPKPEVKKDSAEE